jgi:ubiquinone biosynthesis protein
VLTLEFLDGIKVSELTTAATGPFVRERIARRGADAMLRQYLDHGFFHADPHPGNILVLADDVIGFLDFGMVGRVDRALRMSLSRIVRSVAARDVDRLSEIVLDIAQTHGDLNRGELRHDISDLVESYADIAIGDLSMAAVLRDVVATAARHRLRLPANLMLLIKSVVTIESVGRQLDPTFKMVAHARPMAEALWRKEHAPAAVAARAVRASRSAVMTLADLPRQADGVLRNARGQSSSAVQHRTSSTSSRDGPSSNGLASPSSSRRSSSGHLS